MGGVTVSAKAEGKTITTSVFTDEAGGYYFPPLTSGKYRVWAQALSYETAKSTIDLSAAKRQDFAQACGGFLCAIARRRHASFAAG
jgi:hypothetical protein